MTKEEKVKFAVVKELILKLIHENTLPTPKIIPAFKTDPCDYTCPEEIRLNIPAAGLEIDNNFYAHHVFAHWLCNMEQTNCSDKVANYIADLIPR